jgi:acetoin utilization deacetylase AcuC-like enzyme
VAIVDFDVHHGNGTQWSFYDDPSVLFVSSHQYPYYPGTGAAEDVGKGGGAGFTLNVPLSAGATDADYEIAYSRLAFPVLRQFRPELILVSAGFDAHMDDPLAGMRLTSAYFGRLMRALADAADEFSQGRLVAITEGGYDLAGLSSSLRASISALTGASPTHDAPGGPAPRGEAAIKAVTPHVSKYWKL